MIGTGTTQRIGRNCADQASRFRVGIQGRGRTSRYPLVHLWYRAVASGLACKCGRPQPLCAFKRYCHMAAPVAAQRTGSNRQQAVQNHQAIRCTVVRCWSETLAATFNSGTQFLPIICIQYRGVSGDLK